jgi:guanylate kinase
MSGSSSGARRPAFPLVISGPSGVGKTSVAAWLLEHEPDTVLSVSCTTRECRGQEVDGIDYHYIDEKEFLDRRDRGEFAEWALVHGHLYGTPKEFLERRIAEGKIVVLDIDVQGGAQIRRSRADAVLVFLLPPSMDELEERLRGRHTDPEEVIARRLASAREEIATARTYDYWIVNHDLAETREAVRAIVRAERCRRERLQALKSSESEPILAETGLVPERTDAPENLERK